MSEQEKRELKDKLENGLKQSYEDLLRRKAALGQDMVFADKNGKPGSVVSQTRWMSSTMLKQLRKQKRFAGVIE